MQAQILFCHLAPSQTFSVSRYFQNWPKHEGGRDQHNYSMDKNKELEATGGYKGFAGVWDWQQLNDPVNLPA